MYKLPNGFAKLRCNFFTYRTVPLATNGLYISPDFNYFSTSSSESISPPPRKLRRFFYKLVAVGLLTTGALAGVIYSSQTVRDQLIKSYPDSKEPLQWIERSIGGWRSSKPTVFEKHDELAFLAEPSYTQEETYALPTVDDVKEVTKQTWVPKNHIEFSQIPMVVQEAQQKVGKARSKLKELELATNNYIQALRVAVQENSTSTKQKCWDTVSKLENLKIKTKDQVDAFVEEANEKLQELRHAIDQHKNSENAHESDVLGESITAYGDLRYMLTEAINVVRKLQTDVAMLRKYRDLIAASHGNLQEDLSSLLEQVDLKEKPKDGSSMTVEELNDLISIAHHRIVDLQSKLKHAELNERERLKSALDAQCRADEVLSNERITQALEYQRSKHELERLKWDKEARLATEKKLQHALGQHSEHLTHMLQLEHEKMEYEHSFRLREALAQQNASHEAALAKWIQRMKAIEDVVDGRAELDRVAKETQTLWLACVAFARRLTMSGIPFSGAATTSEDFLQTGPLREFVDAIKEAASTGNHPFAVIISEQLPDVVAERGVWIERGLKERFNKVYKICRRVALIDETGGNLLDYALSWLQSVLLFDLKYKCLKALATINPSVIGDTKLLLAGDTELVHNHHNKLELDTFCLLSSAKEALTTNTVTLCSDDEDDGEITKMDTEFTDDGIELAVRLLGQLRGQPRLVVEDWLKDARLYLESKQTAQALLAYATALNISTFQKRL